MFVKLNQKLISGGFITRGAKPLFIKTDSIISITESYLGTLVQTSADAYYVLESPEEVMLKVDSVNNA